MNRYHVDVCWMSTTWSVSVEAADPEAAERAAIDRVWRDLGMSERPTTMGAIVTHTHRRKP